MTGISVNDTTNNSNTAIKVDNVLNGTDVSVSAATTEDNIVADAATGSEQAADLAKDADYMKYATEYERRLQNKKADC